MRGPNFSEGFTRLGENLRPLDPNSEAWSTTSKGRQIERDLGIGN